MCQNTTMGVFSFLLDVINFTDIIDWAESLYAYIDRNDTLSMAKCTWNPLMQS